MNKMTSLSFKSASSSNVNAFFNQSTTDSGQSYISHFFEENIILENAKYSVFEIANMFYSINKNKTVIEKLMEYLENVSNSVNLYNDEIALLAEMFKCV